jgi:hypothetical protein
VHWTVKFGAFHLPFDDDGEGDLDGFAVFKWGEFEVLAVDEVAAGGLGGAKGGVALVKAVAEVAPEDLRRGRRLCTAGRWF